MDLQPVAESPFVFMLHLVRDKAVISHWEIHAKLFSL